MSESSGPAPWLQQVIRGAQNSGRIVLHGNVRDSQLDSRDRVRGLIDLLAEQLRGLGYQRILRYDLVHPLQILSWGEAQEEGLQDAFLEFAQSTGRQFNPARARFDEAQSVLPLVHHLLAQPVPAAAILWNSEVRIQTPSPEATQFHTLHEGSSILVGPDGTPLRNIAIHLFARAADIPSAWVSVDPDTRLVLIPLPTYGERLRLLRVIGAEHALVCGNQETGPIGVERAARETEGLRLVELRQLIRLAEEVPMDRTGIRGLLTNFRLGPRGSGFRDRSLLDVQQRLGALIHGQVGAVTQVWSALLRAKHQIARLIDEDNRSPAMALFFVGPTGVGKTLMARSIAQVVLGSRESLKIIDMSEYRQDHSDQRLIGPPPGYVGHLEGGQLTNWVQARPNSVVLFDEVEKADERILDLFLQILDGARLTDGKGETVDLSETVLIFTSNLGASNEDDQDLAEDAGRADTVSFYTSRVEEHFREILERPELFNRLKKGIVVFDRIDKKTAREVLVDKLEAVAVGTTRRLADQGFGSSVVFHRDDPEDQELVDRILPFVEFHRYGLRDLNNAVELKVGSSIAELLESPPQGVCYRLAWDEGRELVRLVSELPEWAPEPQVAP